METGRASPKQAVQTTTWIGRWRRGHFFMNALLLDRGQSSYHSTYIEQFHAPVTLQNLESMTEAAKSLLQAIFKLHYLRSFTLHMVSEVILYNLIPNLD